MVQVIRGGVESTVTFNDNGMNNGNHEMVAQPATRPAAPKHLPSDTGRLVTDADEPSGR